jgi:hypothetical protein
VHNADTQIHIHRWSLVLQTFETVGFRLNLPNSELEPTQDIQGPPPICSASFSASSLSDLVIQLRLGTNLPGSSVYDLFSCPSTSYGCLSDIPPIENYGALCGVDQAGRIIANQLPQTQGNFPCATGLAPSGIRLPGYGGNSQQAGW